MVRKNISCKQERTNFDLQLQPQNTPLTEKQLCVEAQVVPPPALDEDSKLGLVAKGPPHQHYQESSDWTQTLKHNPHLECPPLPQLVVTAVQVEARA
jgi:hypothetical protein